MKSEKKFWHLVNKLYECECELNTVFRSSFFRNASWKKEENINQKDSIPKSTKANNSQSVEQRVVLNMHATISRGTENDFPEKKSISIIYSFNAIFH